MVLGDMKLRLAILEPIAAVASLRRAAAGPLIGGGLLLVGSRAIVARITAIDARQI